MGSFIPLLRSNKLTCVICGRTSRSAVLRFDGGRKAGYLCDACAGISGRYVVSLWQFRNPLLPPSLRINAWPVLALCLTALGTVAVVFILSGLAWIALRTIFLMLSAHV
jgi:hypothetical protein